MVSPTPTYGSTSQPFLNAETSFLYPEAKPSVICICSSRDVVQRDSFSIEVVHDDIGSIPSLLLLGRPSAITWFVVSIFVWKSIKACIWRPLAHVFKKVFKLLPSLTHLDATTAVPAVSGCFAVRAPGIHRGPTSISWRRSPGSCLTVCNLWLKTATAFGMACKQALRCYHGFFSASAFATPHRSDVSSDLSSTSDYGEPSKFSTKQIGFFWHGRMLAHHPLTIDPIKYPWPEKEAA